MSDYNFPLTCKYSYNTMLELYKKNSGLTPIKKAQAKLILESKAAKFDSILQLDKRV